MFFFSILVNACVNSVCDYASEVTGFLEYDCKNQIFLRAARAFPGLPKSTPVPAIIAETGWLTPVHRTQLKMVRQFNRVQLMSESRLTKQIIKVEDIRRG